MKFGLTGKYRLDSDHYINPDTQVQTLSRSPAFSEENSTDEEESSTA